MTKLNCVGIDEHISGQCRVILLPGSKKAGTQNPVILLDEIDKLGRDF